MFEYERIYEEREGERYTQQGHVPKENAEQTYNLQDLNEQTP